MQVLEVVFGRYDVLTEPTVQWLHVIGREAAKTQEGANGNTVTFAGSAGPVVLRKGRWWDMELCRQIAQRCCGDFAWRTGETPFAFKELEQDCKAKPVAVNAIW